MSEIQPTDYNKFLKEEQLAGNLTNIDADEFANKVRSFAEIYDWLLYDARKKMHPKTNLRLRYLR